jgi:hypothetical protein
MRSMEHLLNMLRGYATALELMPKTRRYHVDRHGFATDAQRLRDDFQAIGHDMRAQLKRESINYRTR